ncbi:MAG: iron-containing alcohol dehydrogenase [Halanaeroarchaeum sp.]
MPAVNRPSSGPDSIVTPGTVDYGFGATDELTSFLEEHGVERALVVTDLGVRDAGATDPVVARLEEAGVEITVFDDVRPDPAFSTVRRAAEAGRSSNADAVLGVGGGSSLDTAKLAAVLTVHDVPITETVGTDTLPGAGVPLALLPTTAGTGSEMTHVGVYENDVAGGNKVVVFDEALLADHAIVDPALTATMPRPVAAATGMDALTHAIEAYVSLHRTPFADALAKDAIERIGDSLGAAVHQGPDNDRARREMSVAAMLAGQAFINAGLGAVHAMTYPVGIHVGVGHGRANAVLLPHVMRYNLPAEPERYATVARLLGEERTPGQSVRDFARQSVEAVRTLNEDIGIPNRLRDLGEVDRDSFDEFATTCIEHSEHNLRRNPRAIDHEDLVALFEEAY